MGARVGASAESDMRRFFEGEGAEAVAGVSVLTVRVSLVMPFEGEPICRGRSWTKL